MGAMKPQGAVVDGPYRYLLWRTVPGGEGRVCFVMLNPSVADAARDDPTLRRCLGFARAWGFGALDVCNLFAYRTTDPAALASARDPVGPRNDRYLARAFGRATLVVAAWGAGGVLGGRAGEVAAAARCELRCLGLTKGGQPRHPLYVRAATPLVAFEATRQRARREN